MSIMFRRIPWQDVCKFLAGAFFETSGILIYLWAYDIPVPIFRTGLVQTPAVAGLRAIGHTVLFVAFFYLGFVRRWKARTPA